jgi:hypothetical protein
MMCTVLLVFAVILAISLRTELDPGMLGLAFVYMNSLSGLFQFMVRQSALVETYMTSVERLLFYSNEIVVEGDGEELCPDLGHPHLHQAPLEHSDWPCNGELVVEGLHARYRYPFSFNVTNCGGHKLRRQY